jgi:hypothetical protein
MFLCLRVGKIQALLVFGLALRVGKNQMCLNVRSAFYLCRSFCSLSLSFSIGGNGLGYA